MTDNKAPQAKAPESKAPVKGPETPSTAPVPAPATPASATPEPKALTNEEIAKRIDALPDVIKKTITGLNDIIAVHNSKVAKLTAAEKQDTGLIKADIFEQSTDPKLKALRAEYVKLCESLDALKDQAYEHIDKAGLMPEALDEKAIAKLKSDTAESLKDIKAKSAAFTMFEEMAPELKLSELITEVKTRRGTGTGKSSTSSGGTTYRPRFKRIEVNNQVEDDKGNKVYGLDSDGNPKYTLTFTAKYLGKQHTGISWTSKDLQDAYFAGEDPDNLPDVKEFEMPHTYKDANGNEQTIVYKVKAFRP